MGYDTGGSGSSPEAAGFLRIMKNHTATGMAMKMSETQMEPIPIPMAAAGSELPPTSIFAPGTKLAKVASAP